MSAHYLVQLYWPGRTDARAAMAKQVAAFLAEIAPLDKRLAGFLFYDKRSRETVSASSPEACERGLAAGEIHWKTGSTERTSYEQRFFLDRRAGSPVHFTITCGIEPLGLEPIWTPNRLAFFVRKDVGDERASRAVLEGVLRIAVKVFRPDWAFAGTDEVPLAPQALFSEGEPCVGWMTYLRAAFPEVPRTLPQPSVVYPLDGLGTLIVAHPELFDDRDPGHRAAMARVREVLVQAKVLVAPSALPKA